MSNPKKTMDLEKLVQHPSSLKLLILHTPFPLQISSLWRCSNLIKLDLSKNNLESFPYIGNLANLKFMFLHQNKLDHKILRNIFFSQSQSHSPLSKSIVWVTFWGNKNVFQARHFLCNQTSVLAVDNHVVVPEERKQSILIQQIEPFTQQTDVSFILTNKQSLAKSATEEEYMDQFWQQMRELRRKIQFLCPIIKVQKIYRGWISRKLNVHTRQQAIQSYQLKEKAFNSWKNHINRNKNLLNFLKSRNKQHYLLPLKQMRLQEIQHKMLEWATRAKKKVLLRKALLSNEVKFYKTLRDNMLMFQSIYKQLQIDKSNFLLIDAQSYKEVNKEIRKFVSLFNEQETFSEQNNKKYLIRQVFEGHSKRQLARLLTINKCSYAIRLDYEPKLNPNINRTLLNENICHIPAHSTQLKPLFKNQNKLHFNLKEKKSMQKWVNQLQKRQRMILQEFVVIRGSPRVLKDVVRCVYYLDTKAISVEGAKQLSEEVRVKLFSEKSLQRLSSVSLIQKFWRGYIFRKKQKQNAQICARQYRAVVKIQRWVRNLPQRKKQAFIKECIPILRSINDPYFVVKMQDYLKFIQNDQDQQSNYLLRMKLLEQNLTPYFNLSSKKITLYWNTDEQGPAQYKQKIRICNEINKNPLNQYLRKSIFRSQDPNYNPFYLTEKDIDSHQKGELSHLFHFNTLTSLAQKDNLYWLKISCNSVEETKIRVFGILLKSYSFKKGLGIKIYDHEVIDFKKHMKKNVLNNESIFITKGDVTLKQENQKIQKYNFKSKFYLKDEEDQKPAKIEENLLIFAHFLNTEVQSHSRLKNSISEPDLKVQIEKPKKRTKLSVEQLYFPQNNCDNNQTIEINSKIVTLNKQRYTQSIVTKTDLMPTALKRILPLKKQIKSYKLQKRIKKREPSFVLDNSAKHQRVTTLPDLTIDQSSKVEQQDKSQFQYSTVKQKIKRNYIYRKDLMKSQRQEKSFHQNFVNLNNFLQQQSISEQRRRIRTEIQITAYQSADRIRNSLQKSADALLKRKEEKMKKVENDIKNHKQALQKNRLLKEQQKESFQRAKSMERQKSKRNKQDVRRLKVSFAEQCFPILNRSSTYNLRSGGQSLSKSGDKRFYISSTTK